MNPQLFCLKLIRPPAVISTTCRRGRGRRIGLRWVPPETAISGTEAVLVVPDGVVGTPRIGLRWVPPETAISGPQVVIGVPDGVVGTPDGRQSGVRFRLLASG